MEAPATPFWAVALLALGLGLRLAAGVSILARAVRLRGVAELMIGLFVVLLATGELAAITGTSLRGTAPLGVLQALGLLGLVLVIAAQVALAEGLRRIFRPSSVGARLLAGSLAAALIVAGALRVASGGLLFVTHPSVASVTLLGVALLTELWWSAESVLFGRRLRKRLALGIGDPEMVVRFDLWAAAALSHACMFACLMLCALVWRRPAAELPGVLAVLGVTGLLSALSVYGSFHPPQLLVRRFARAAAPA